MKLYLSQEKPFHEKRSEDHNVMNNNDTRYRLSDPTRRGEIDAIRSYKTTIHNETDMIRHYFYFNTRPYILQDSLYHYL